MRFWAKSNARIFLQIQYFVGMFWYNDTLSYCAGCYTSTFTQNKLLCNSTYILTSTKYLIACFYKTSNVFIKPKNQVKNIKSNEMQEYWDFFLFFVLVWYSIAVKLISLWKKKLFTVHTNFETSFLGNNLARSYLNRSPSKLW